VIAEKDPGRCPICRRDLILVNATLSWTCPGRPDIDRQTAGKCPDGSPTEVRYTQEPHANHSPRHGGLFFMAPDSWHHLEGTFSRDGTFRLYMYDDYTKPITGDRLKQISGRLVTKETFDTATRTTTELAVVPLRAAESGEYFEARTENITMPGQMTAKMKFPGNVPEYRFDFSFPGFTEEKPIGAVSDSILLEVPDEASEILELFRQRVQLIADLVKKGSFGEVWVPALQSKDLALALDARTKELPPARRSGATASVERLVRAAWLLDEYGDLGNRQQVESAFAAFSAAAGEVDAVFSAASFRARKPGTP
jgi:hypothetical protein